LKAELANRLQAPFGVLAVWCNSQRLWQSVWGTRRISSVLVLLHVVLGAKPPPRLSVLTGLAGEEMALIWFLLCYGSEIRGLG
jgi:hypothetical protein